MSSHPTVRLGEICRPKQWKILSKKELVADGFPVYGANGKIGFATEFTHAKPTLLIGCRGSCGAVHITEPFSYANGNAMSLDDLNKESIEIKYLYHYLRHRGFRDVITGTSQPQIIQQHLIQVEIPLPPLEEQRRIAAILDKAQELKAKAAQRSGLLSALGRSLFVRSFGLPSENPYEFPLYKLVHICNPKQWPTISSKQLQDRGYPVYGANGLIGYFDTFNHSDPTVLVTCRGATCGTINVSPPNCYVTGNSMAMDDPDCALITTEYLEWALRLRGMHDVISGSAQPQITRQGLEAVTIPVPSIEAQNYFANELKALSRMGVSSQLSENSISEVMTSLVSRLFEVGRA
jgi:type I restriction enzyme S subunit